MKKPLIGSGLIALALTAGIGLWAKDPIVMTVNGEDVPLSEFVYLYGKNKQQQATLQPIDEYAEIFKIYKLKVADAKAMGIDTLDSFKKEYAQYRSELAQPYLVDSAYLNSLVDIEFKRLGEEIETYHIMRFKTRDDIDNRASMQLLDSIRGLLAEGADFAELAATYSQDKGSNLKGGLVGWVMPMRFPYAFEDMVYTLKPGEVSEVFDSGAAYHIIKTGNRRPNEGRMSASHIMKMVPLDAPEDEQERAKTKIDSIYNVLQEHPELFEKLCVFESDDKNNSRKGGILPPFYRSEMVPEFSDKAFAMADGEISEPVRSEYGWHIIKRFSMSPSETLGEIKPKVLQALRNPADKRASMIMDRQRLAYAKEFKLMPNAKVKKDVETYIAANGIDSLFIDKYFGDAYAATPLYTFKGGAGQVTLGDMAGIFKGYVNTDAIGASKEWARREKSMVRKKLMEAKEENLERAEPEYRNLLHEFRDGSLLYEAGRQKVWDKAGNDTIGLNNYFETHRNEYTWKEPRVKGFLLQATNDSVEQKLRARLAELTPKEYIKTIRKEFGSDVQIDKVLAAKGVNALVDYCVLGGKETKPSNSKYNKFFMYDFRVIDTPEDVSDVRGLVTSDYQNVLETEWVEEIKDKYPVIVYEKVLKKVK